MLRNKEKFREVLKNNNITDSHIFKNTIVYFVNGEWGCSSLHITESILDFKNKFILEIPDKPVIELNDVIDLTLFISKTPGQLSIDARPGLIYDNHPGETILEEADFTNFCIIFRCKSKLNKDRYDYYLFKNFKLLKIFEDFDKINYDRYDFSPNGPIILSKYSTKDASSICHKRYTDIKEIWKYLDGKLYELDENEVSFPFWSWYFCRESFASEYSYDNIMSPTEFNISDKTDVIWECNKGHKWKESIYSRVQKYKNLEDNYCPFCKLDKYNLEIESLETRTKINNEILEKLEMTIQNLNNGLLWNPNIKVPDTIDYYFYYPAGKDGDITMYIAQKSGVVEKIDGLLHKVTLSGENYELFYCLKPGSSRQLNQRNIKILNNKNKEFNDFMFQYFLPMTLQYLTEICRDRCIDYDNEVIRNYNHRPIVREKRKELYDILLKEGFSSSKWTSEKQLYVIVKEVFTDTIYQYKTNWLGHQSLDIFIPSKNIAIEYQGRQHYEPVKLFGGENGFKERLKLDEKKRHLCEENNVILLEWKYDEPITKTSVLNRLEKFV